MSAPESTAMSPGPALGKLRRRVEGQLRKVVPSLLEGDKRRLIDHAFDRFEVRSFADFGAVWRVNGGYTFHALKRNDIDRAYIVDGTINEETSAKAKAFPQLTLIESRFDAPEAREAIGQVDAILLFDVLVHQGAPSWSEILGLLADHTDVFLIVNQQWTGSGTIRLLDLSREEYFANTPEHAHHLYDAEGDHPKFGVPWRDVHTVWQWGITDGDLTSRMDELGFEPVHAENWGAFHDLDKIENHAFIFGRRGRDLTHAR